MTTRTKAQLRELLRNDLFPRSSNYDPSWIVANEMGPHPLWLTEFLCESMRLEQGMRVLDLGCGKALSSIFLAREFDLQVWATDLWVPASDNFERVRAENLDEQVFPIHADVRRLPFAAEFFDAIISIDAFEYFGTDAAFLPSIIPLLKPGGEIGIVNAGVLNEIDSLPDEWPDDFCTFHTSPWWARHWSKSRCVDVHTADYLPNGREIWLKWNEVVEARDDEYLTSSAGNNLGFNRVVATRTR